MTQASHPRISITTPSTPGEWAHLEREIIDKLNAELNAVLSDPAVRERLNGMGIAAIPSSADKFGQEIQRDLTRYASVVKSAGIKLDQ